MPKTHNAKRQVKLTVNKNDNNSTFKNNEIMNNSINGIDKNNKQKVKYHWEGGDY